jgi:TRAP-type mannitol/chloroaromatic compound transport system permease small subunit
MIFLLGAADTLRQDKHVRVDLVYGRLGTRGRAITNLIGGLLALLPFCFALLYF